MGKATSHEKALADFIYVHADRCISCLKCQKDRLQEPGYYIAEVEVDRLLRSDNRVLVLDYNEEIRAKNYL